MSSQQLHQHNRGKICCVFFHLAVSVSASGVGPMALLVWHIMDAVYVQGQWLCWVVGRVFQIAAA